MQTPSRSVAVVGAGAVGSYFGGLLARAGHDVTLVGRPAHIQAVEQTGLRIERAGGADVISMHGSVDLSAIRDADLVLVCVKSPDTAAIAKAMTPHLRPDAVVLSLQNSVENAPILAKTLPHMVVAACVYVAVALAEPGLVRHFGRGDLVIGEVEPSGHHRAPATHSHLQDIADLFATANIPVTISGDVRRELWLKLVANCAFNAISALAQTSYGRLVAVPEVQDVQQAIVREVVDVANADAVDLSLEAAFETVERIAVSMADQQSSTAQDVARRKPTEIDHLNGFIARRGGELGVPTPMNQMLHALVKLLEAGYGSDQQ